MRKVSIFLDSSVLVQIMAANNGLLRPTMALLAACQGDEATYEAYYSALSIHELSQRYSIPTLKQLTELLNSYSIKLLKHQAPKEVDYFAINLKYGDKIQVKNEYDLYNLAYYSITTIENYVSWNLLDVVKYRLADQLARDYLSSGYRAYRHMNINNPQYFLGKESPYYPVDEELIQQYAQSKSIDIESKPEYIYEKVQDWYFRHLADKLSAHVEEMPNSKVREQRVIKEEVAPTTTLAVSVKSYEKEIAARAIPLLRFKAAEVMFDMDYSLFSISFTKGQVMIEERLKDLLFHRPLKEEVKLTKEEFQQLKVAELFNTIMAGVRPVIDQSGNSYAPFNPGEVQEVSIRNIDTTLTDSFSNLYSYYKIKKEAVELVEYLLGNEWQDYRAFTTVKTWTRLHDYGGGAVDARNSIFLLEKTGRSMIVILFSYFID